MPTTIPPHERAANEFWVYAIRNKGLVLSVVVVSNLLALLLFSLADSVYESRVGIVVGRAFIDGKIRRIEGGGHIVYRFRAEYEITGRNDANLKVYKPIIINDRGLDFIFFIVRGNDRDVMKKFVRKPLAKLLAEHELILANGQKALKLAAQELQVQLDAINLQIENLEGKRRALPSAGSTLQDKPEKNGERVFVQKAKLESLLNDLRSHMLKPKPTRLLRYPAASVPVSPKLMLYLFLASVVGIILGLFGAVVQGRRNEQIV